MRLAGRSRSVLSSTLFLCARDAVARQKNAGMKMTNDPADEVSIERLQAAIKLLDAGWKLGQPLPGEPGFSVCCPSCKTQVLASAKFCRVCGQPVTGKHHARASRKRAKFVVWWGLKFIVVVLGFALINSVEALIPRSASTTTELLAAHSRERAKAFVGVWVEVPAFDPGGTMRRLTLRCRPELTFEEQCRIFDQNGREIAGDYIGISGKLTVDGNSLVCDVQESTRPDLAPLGRWTYSVIATGGDELVLRMDSAPCALPDTEKDRTIRYRRQSD